MTQSHYVLIDDDSYLAQQTSVAAFMNSKEDSKLDLDVVEAVLNESSSFEMTRSFISLHSARIVVGSHNIIYASQEGKVFATCYGKSWQYEDGLRSLPQDCVDGDVIAGTWLACSTSPITNNLYHLLMDNMVQVYNAKFLEDDSLKVLFSHCGALLPDTKALSDTFLEGRSCRFLPRGTYRVERLILPPPSSKGNHYLVDCIRFAQRRLKTYSRTKNPSHRLRLFVSRSDAASRRLINETSLFKKLQSFGFTIICPGDFSLMTQIELFSAAEAIVGVHGMGLTPMLASSDCRVICEYEAYGWESTPYRAFAAALGMRYLSMPVRMIDADRGGQFDWLAEADTALSVELIEAALL